jgi:hypothetical protein
LQVGGSGNVRLKLYKYNLTDKQDLKLSIGYDVAAEQGRLTKAGASCGRQGCLHAAGRAAGPVRRRPGRAGARLASPRLTLLLPAPQTPFVKLEENNWGVRLQQGSWQFLYDF